jgi:hypothetical protein
MSEERIAREVRQMVAGFPAPRPGFRQRVLSAVPDERGQSRHRWAAVAAAVLALILVATLVLGVRGLLRTTQPARHPTPTPSPTATVVDGALKVPESMPVVPFIDPGDPRQIDAMTWTGQGPGRLTYRLQTAYLAWSSSPDGSRFLSDTAAFDRNGQTVGSVSSASKVVVWADDSRHLCALEAPGPLPEGPTTLQVSRPGDAPRGVAQLGTIYAQSAPRVLACSILNDRAVVVQQGPIGNALELWVLRLSTGKLLFHTTFSPSGPQTFVSASRDGQLLGVSTVTSSVKGCCGQPDATIVRASDGAPQAHVAGRLVRGFSWSGDLAITDDQAGGGVPGVIQWRTGRVRWSGPAGSRYQASMSEPGGSRVAIAASSAADPTARVEDIWIVSANGSSGAPVRGTWL